VDWRVTVVSSNFIALLLIISISLSIHIIVRYQEIASREHTLNQDELVSLTIQEMFKPCLYTALTTMVAFASLSISDIKPVIEFGKDFSINNIRLDKNGTTFDYESNKLKLKDVTVNLLGEHQAHNCAVAITAFNLFLERTSRSLDEKALRAGLRSVNWPGRMQILQNNPTVIIDGAHNEEGIDALVRNINQIFPNTKIHFVLAILRDKNLERIIKQICQVSYKLYISKNHSTRAAEIEEQAEIAKTFGTEPLLIPDVVEATKVALKNAKPDELVFISGSLYTISEILAVKKELFN
jgi:dihydrofolate synthase/folylpolyglutamate synthase